MKGMFNDISFLLCKNERRMNMLLSNNCKCQYQNVQKREYCYVQKREYCMYKKSYRFD